MKLTLESICVARGRTGIEVISTPERRAYLTELVSAGNRLLLGPSVTTPATPDDNSATEG